MSGGRFDFRQHHIREIWQDIEFELNIQGKERDKENLWSSKEFYEEFPEEKYYPVYPVKVQEIMKEAVKCLKMAEIYTKRVDYYLSGDDGEQTLYRRLEEDLENLKNQKV